MNEAFKNQESIIPEEPNKGLTPSELVRRHFTNKDDVITDEDMENLDLTTSDLNEVHIGAAVEGGPHDEDDDVDDEDEEVDVEDVADDNADDDKKDTQVATHITPWDIIS
ncbi:MAG: hypothetical protein V4722_07740 [Bacteroidota bacterium]